MHEDEFTTARNTCVATRLGPVRIEENVGYTAASQRGVNTREKTGRNRKAKAGRTIFACSHGQKRSLMQDVQPSFTCALAPSLSAFVFTSLSNSIPARLGPLGGGSPPLPRGHRWSRLRTDSSFSRWTQGAAATSSVLAITAPPRLLMRAADD